MRLVGYDDFYITSTIAKLNYSLPPRIIAYLSAGRSFNATLTFEQQRVRRFRGRHHFCSILFDVLALRFPDTSGGCLTHIGQILTANKSIELLLDTVPRSTGFFTKSDWNAMVAFVIFEKTQAEAREFFRDLFSDFFEAALYSFGNEGRWESYQRRRQKAFGSANSWHPSAPRKRKRSRSRSCEVEYQRRSKRPKLTRKYPPTSHPRSSGRNKENLYPDHQFHDRRRKHRYNPSPSVVASASSSSWMPAPSKPPVLPPASSTFAPWKPPAVPLATSVFATTPAPPQLSQVSVSVPMGFWTAPPEPGSGPGPFSEATEMAALDAWCKPKAGLGSLSTAVEHRDIFVAGHPTEGRYDSGTYSGYRGYQRPTSYAEPGVGASREQILRRFG